MITSRRCLFPTRFLTFAELGRRSGHSKDKKGGPEGAAASVLSESAEPPLKKRRIVRSDSAEEASSSSAVLKSPTLGPLLPYSAFCVADEVENGQPVEAAKPLAEAVDSRSDSELANRKIFF